MEERVSVDATGWMYGVPIEYRDLMKAAFPAYDLNFISVRQPTASYEGRIGASINPFFAVWGGEYPDDLRSFAMERKLAVGPVRLTGAFANIPVETALHRALTIVRDNGYFGSAERCYAPLDDAQKAAADALLAQFRQRGTLLTGSAARNDVIAEFLARSSGRQRVVVVPEPALSGDGAMPGTDAALALIAAADARYPGAAIVVMADARLVSTLSGDAGMPRSVGLVAPLRPMAPFLDVTDALVTTGGQAGFEAMVSGCEIYTPIDALYRPARVADLQAPWSLTDDEAAVALYQYVVGDTRWIDTETQAVVDPFALFGEDAALRGLMLNGRGGVQSTASALNGRQVARRRALETVEAQPPTASQLCDHLTISAAESAPFALTGAVAPGTMVFAAFEAVHFRIMAALQRPGGPPAARSIFSAIDPVAGLPPSARLLAESRPDALYRLLLAQVSRLRAVRSVVLFDTTSTVSKMLRRALAAVGIRCILLDIYDELSIAIEAQWGFDAVIARPGIPEKLADRPVPVPTLAMPDGTARSMLLADTDGVAADARKLMHLDPQRRTIGVMISGAGDRGDLTRGVIEELVATLGNPALQGVISLSSTAFATLPASIGTMLLSMPNTYLDFGHVLFPTALDLAQSCDVIVTDLAESTRQLAAAGRAGRSIFVGDGVNLLLPTGANFLVAAHASELPLLLDMLLATPDNRAPLSAGLGDAMATFAADLNAFHSAIDGEAPAAASWMADLSDFERHLVTGGNIDVDCLGIDSGDDAAAASQKYLLQMIGARSRTRAVEPLLHASAFTDVDLFAQWGMRDKPAQRNLRALARQLGAPLAIFEDGLIRSVSIGLAGDPGLSVLIDTRTAYFNATSPSLLETILNSAFELSDDQRREARRLMDLIVRRRISKYNHAPDRPQQFGSAGRPKLLLIDQRFGDMSISLGLGHEDMFPEILWGLVGSRPDADIVIKRHPDALSLLKSSCYGDEVVAPARFMKQVTLVDYDVNPFALIDAVDEVHVVTSGFGFEAVMAGRPVHCHGAPFYAGWGFTTDHKPHPRRNRTRTPEDLFHVAYLMLSRYYSPALGRQCSLEELIDYIDQHKVQGDTI